jgi:hypothetical protein
MQMSICKSVGSIDYVHLDFTHTYCPGGCCRPITACISSWIQELPPTILHVLGLRDGEENEFTLTDGDDLTHTTDEMEARFGLRILKRGEKTEWDSWKL